MGFEREKNYLDQVCSHVKWKQAHESIRWELSAHMEDIREEQKNKGMDEEAASEYAVREMGSSELVGKSLNQAYRPRISVHALGMLAVLIVSGIIMRITLEQINTRSVITLMLGAVTFGLIVRFMNLKPFMKYAKQISYGYVLLGIIMFLAYFALQMLMTHYWRFMEGAILCWQIFQPLAVMLMMWSLREKELWGVIQMGIFCIAAMVPALLIPNVAAVLIVAVVDVGLILYGILSEKLGKKKWKMILLLVSGVLCISALGLLLLDGYQLDRVRGIFSGDYRNRFQNFIVSEILGYCNFIGEANFPASFTGYKPLEYIGGMQTDYCLLSLAIKWGVWIYYAVALMIGTTLSFLFKWILKQRGDFVRMLCLAVLAVFFVQIAEYYMVNLGLWSISTMSLPFLSSGNLMMIANFALMGVLFSTAGGGYIYESEELRRN